MSRSTGPGSPLYFFCAMCRKARGWDHKKGARVVRTGRTRKHKSKYNSARGVRSTGEAHEYNCTDCGHTGWSAHVDMKYKPLKAPSA